MSVKKEIQELKNNVENLYNLLLSDVEEKASKCDEMKKYLSQFKIKVKHIVQTTTNSGKPALKIIYECPQVLLEFDDEGNPLENTVFKAINGLNLVDISDFKILINSIDGMKNKKM
ncbi:MAG: hypothetical protein IKF82_01155 [Bacilli bacterium]|nr:hypothetical protein [Bacilli bacterium]